MSNIITGTIAVAMALVFFMFYPIRLYEALGFMKSLPVWIIVIMSLGCLVYDFYHSLKEDDTPPKKSTYLPAPGIVPVPRNPGGRRRDQPTRSRGSRPAKTASRLSSARNPMASLVSFVALPICGIRNTLGNSRYPGWMSGSLL